MPLPRRVGHAVLVSEDNRSVLHPAWEKFLEIVSPERVSIVKNCGSHYDAYRCVNGHEVHRKLYCKDYDACGTDMWRYREQQVSDALDIIYDVNEKMVERGISPAHFQYTTMEFTIPKRLWRDVGFGGLKKLKRLALESLSDVLCDDGRLLLGGLVSAHYWSSTEPLIKGIYPHIHVTLFRWVADKEMLITHDNKRGLYGDGDTVITKGGFMDMGVGLSRKDLQAVKEAWKHKVDVAFGCPASQRRFKTYNVFVHWSKGFGRLHHRLAYMMRSANFDIHKRVTTFGYSNGEIDLDWVKAAMFGRKNEHRYDWFGWLQPTQRNKYLAWVSHHVEPKKERERERKQLRCPFCGEKMMRSKRFIPFAEVVVNRGLGMSYNDRGGDVGFLTVGVSVSQGKVSSLE